MTSKGRVLVIGAGTMGSGIAQVAAASGFEAVAVDRKDVLDRARERVRDFLEGSVSRGKMTAGARDETLSRLHFRESVTQALPADLVIEAVFEETAVKAEVLSQIPKDFRGLVATNTSSFSVNALAVHAPDPTRFLGLHFFNPPPLMALVEVVAGEETSLEAVNAATSIILEMGKVPVQVKDGPGFIVNRVARPFYLESLRLLGDERATHESIDRLLEGRSFKMGPFRLMDLIGLDVNLAVSTSVYQQTKEEPRFKPHPIQSRLVAEGKLGRKSGEGFYTYE